MPAQTLTDGDGEIYGFNSRVDPANLPKGLLQYSENMRLQRGSATPRLGAYRLTGTYMGQVSLLSYKAVGTYIRQSDGYEFMAVAGYQSLVLFNQDGTVFHEYPYVINAGPTSPNDLYIPTPNAQIVQALDKLYIFRGQAQGVPVSCTFTNPSIPANTWGKITISGFNVVGLSPYTEFLFQSASNTNAYHVLNGAYTASDPVVNFPNNVLIIEWYNNTGSTFNAHTTPQNGMTIQIGYSPLVWDLTSSTVGMVPQNFTTGTTANVPPSDFAIYYQNRLVCKNGDHNIAVSDILSDTFDLTFNSFNVNVGSADGVVGFLPWIENQMVVMMKKSVYLCYFDPTVTTTGAPGVNSKITVITSEIGCLSRRTIVNAGDYVFFLSAKGVYMLTPQLDMKLVGNTLPLSEPVADIFEKINFNVAYKACAAYYFNRFYISFAYNGSSDNNIVLVYNTLNKLWESADKYPSTMFIDEFFINAYGNTRKLMAGCRMWIGYNDIGDFNPPGIALLEDEESATYNQAADYFNYNSSFILIPTFYTASARTREYQLGTFSKKYFPRCQAQYNSVAGKTTTITANTHNPDTTEVVLSYTFADSKDSTLRPRVASRGSSIDFQIVISPGITLKGIYVDAIVADRQMISEE